MTEIFLHRDSEAKMSRAYNKIYNEKSRRISLRLGYVRQLITNIFISVI